MIDIFIHDAVPTWSGFIYQGEIAIYLAAKKICDLRDKENLKEEEIGSNYSVEVENCEDISLVHTKKGRKEYLSIHQVKNQKDKNIGAYRSPLVQLMLEKAFYKMRGLGDPEAYLHTSNNINEKNIDKKLNEWKEEILKYYESLKIFLLQINERNKIKLVEDIKKVVASEPIKLNRKEYRELIDKIKAFNIEKSDVIELKGSIENLMKFLEEVLSITTIDTYIKVYEYEDKKKYCNGSDIFYKIVEQVKRYKYNDDNINDNQYEYIANKLLNIMREHILKRHKLKQKKGNYGKAISFCDIQNILNNDLLDYEREANILTLRRLYDERLVEYCLFYCENKCISKNEDVVKCKLNQKEFRRVDLDDNEFVKLCYSLNPDCDKLISDRGCLSLLLNVDGLNESVFRILKEIPEKYFMKKNDKRKFVLDNKSNNAFLTAISSNNSSRVVQVIVNGIQNNSELVSPIFDADQIITTRLECDESVWDSDYSEIQEKYMIRESDDNQNSICNPKKPEFIKVDKVINELLKIDTEE